MAKTVQVEVWVLVDSCGDYAIGTDAELARNSYCENVQDLTDNCEGCRMVKLTLTVPLPVAIEISAVVPASDESATVQVS